MKGTRIKTNIADLREEPRSDSRRSSQLLFNESVEIIRKNGDWALVEGPDSYRGWIRKAYLSDYEMVGEDGLIVSLQAPVLSQGGRLLTRLSFGTVVSGEPKDEHFRLRLPDGRSGKVKMADVELRNRHERPRIGFGELTSEFVGIPYLWGGTSSFGFDCSGFVQRIYRYYGFGLPRDSDQQRDRGKTVELEELGNSENLLVIGDLIFFNGHVGLYLGGGRMIHSSRHHNGVNITDLNSATPYVNHLGDIFDRVRRVHQFNRKIQGVENEIN